MDDNYHLNLQTLTRSFLGTNEHTAIADAIASHFATGPVRILDIGTGTGHSIRKIAALLEQRGIQPEVIGLDIFLPEGISIPTVSSHVTLIQCSFEQFLSPDSFDVVSVTQSLYYLGGLRASLSRMLSFVGPGGILLAVAWTKNCVLHRIYDFMGLGRAESVTSELVAEELKAIDATLKIDIRLIEGKVDLRSWIDDDDLLRAAAHILSRSPSSTDMRLAQVRELRDYITRSFPSIAPRQNGLVIASRPTVHEGASES